MVAEAFVAGSVVGGYENIAAAEVKTSVAGLEIADSDGTERPSAVGGDVGNVAAAESSAADAVTAADAVAVAVADNFAADAVTVAGRVAVAVPAAAENLA